MIRRALLFCMVLVPLYLHSQTKEYYPDPDTLVQQKLEEWQDMKFGLLMHWGPYSQWGIVESWSICPEDLSWATGGRKKGVADNYFDYVKQYEQLQSTFNPTQFSPESWAKVAKEAGMKYVVFTTKHHDGFCMFDTKLTDYKITDPKTPFSSNPRSNVTLEIFDAFRHQDFWVGAYFSKPDWHCDYYWWDYFPPVDRNCNYSIQKHPDQWEKFVDFTHGQIDELMSDYGPVDILWLDGGWVRPTSPEEVNGYLAEVYEGSRYSRNPQSQDIDMPELVRNARVKQPGILVVDRAVTGPYQNYLTPEQHIPPEGLPYPWETCMTMATSWSYVPGDKYKSSEKIIETLVDIVSKGGNLLLNIGPSPQGDFDPAAYVTLMMMGNWMKINSEAIYATRRYKTFGQGENIRFTQSKDGRNVYVFFMEFPDKPIILEGFPYESSMKASMLGSKRKVNAKNSNGNLELALPKSLQSDGHYVWVIKLQYSPALAP